VSSIDRDRESRHQRRREQGPEKGEPAAKIPVLILADGTQLFDSHLRVRQPEAAEAVPGGERNASTR
jgi:hypothetical protein